MSARTAVSAVVFCLAASAAPAQPPAPAAPSATLADLAWMAGQWRDQTEGSLSEEVWAAPAGDCMMGMWRWVKDGRVRLFELLTITQDAGGPVLRLRHFDRHSVGREDKDKPVAVALVRHAPGEAVFEGPGSPGRVRITYRKVGEDVLAAVLEKEGDKPQEFRFRRQAAPR